MKSCYFLLGVAFFATVIGFSVHAQTLYNGIGHIPSAYQERWNKAGLLRDMSSVEPKLVINITTISGVDYDQRVQTALSQARSHVSTTAGLAIIYFPTGTNNFYNTIHLTQIDSNIVFQGAGSDRTFLEFRYMEDDPCFDLTGFAGRWVHLHNA